MSTEEAVSQSMGLEGEQANAVDSQLNPTQEIEKIEQKLPSLNFTFFPSENLNCRYYLQFWPLNLENCQTKKGYGF